MENTMENMEVVVDDVMDGIVVDQGSNGIGKVVIGIGIAAAGIIGGLLYKNRNKLTERRIRSLEKAGYIITKVENDYVEGEICEEDFDETK